MNPILVAEQQALGALMLVPGSVDRVYADLNPEHFAHPGHADLVRAMLTLHASGSAIDPVTVAEALETDGLLAGVGGMTYLVELANSAPADVALGSHLCLVHKRHRRRQAQQIGERLASGAMVDDEAPARAAAALAVLDGGAAASDEFDMRRALRETYIALEAAYNTNGELPGTTTGFRSLDATLGGWQPGDLVIVQGRPAMGKTALMLVHAIAAAESGSAVGVVSTEQSVNQLTQRMLAMTSAISLQALRSGQIDDGGWSAITDSITRLQRLPIHILDRGAPSIEQVTRQCRRWSRMGVKVVLIDYLQRITADAPNRREEVSRIARGLKTAAREAGLCVVALAQTVRDVDTRQNNRRPGLADIAESSDCEREADIVVSLYRDEAARPDAADVERGTAELIVVKNRHGPTGVIKVSYNGPRVRFSEMASS